MEFTDFRDRLHADHTRMAEVAADLTARVPSCPDWTVEDLLRHVATVYLHKVACMRHGKAPEDWPPDHSAEPARDLLERAYRELCAEFDTRAPDSHAATWYPPDQTVGFWIRRMAQEAAVHRVDAELAADAVTPVAADLAVDGVDEVLTIFLGWASGQWPDDFELGDGPTVEVSTGGRSWFVRRTPTEVTVTDAGPATTTVTGEPSDVLLWLWRRGEPDRVTVTGDPAGARLLYALMAPATQ